MAAKTVWDNERYGYHMPSVISWLNMKNNAYAVAMTRSLTVKYLIALHSANVAYPGRSDFQSSFRGDRPVNFDPHALTLMQTPNAG